MTSDYTPGTAVRAAQAVCLAGFLLLLMGPFDVPDPLGVGADFSWALICLAAAVAVLTPEVIARGWPVTRLDWPIAVYVAIVVATWVTSVDRSHTLISALALAGQIGVFAAVVAVARRIAWVPDAILVFLVGAIFLILLVATAYHADAGLLTRPKLYPIPAGWTGYPQLGTLAAIQFALLVAALQVGKRRSAIAASATLLVVCVIELALLYARGAWLAAAVVLLAAPLVLVSWKQARRAVLGLCIVVGLTAAVTMWNPMMRRLLLGDQSAPLNGYYLELATPEMRLEIWKRTLRMIGDHPVMGVGLGNFQQVFESRYNPDVNNDGRRGVHAHNLWLQQFAETGVPGGTAYVVLWIGALLLAFRAARAAPAFATVGAFLSITALAASNLTTNLFFLPGLVSGRLHSLGWVLFGLAAPPSAYPGLERRQRDGVDRRNAPRGGRRAGDLLKQVAGFVHQLFTEPPR
jgi:O-Antigen ligase